MDDMQPRRSSDSDFPGIKFDQDAKKNNTERNRGVCKLGNGKRRTIRGGLARDQAAIV
jgi:hypothetical protein